MEGAMELPNSSDEEAPTLSDTAETARPALFRHARLAAALTLALAVVAAVAALFAARRWTVPPSPPHAGAAVAATTRLYDSAATAPAPVGGGAEQVQLVGNSQVRVGGFHFHIPTFEDFELLALNSAFLHMRTKLNVQMPAYFLQKGDPMHTVGEPMEGLGLAVRHLTGLSSIYVESIHAKKLRDAGKLADVEGKVSFQKPLSATLEKTVSGWTGDVHYVLAMELTGVHTKSFTSIAEIFKSYDVQEDQGVLKIMNMTVDDVSLAWTAASVKCALPPDTDSLTVMLCGNIAQVATEQLKADDGLLQAKLAKVVTPLIEEQVQALCPVLVSGEEEEARRL